MTIQSIIGGDQGLLNQFFSNWAREDIRKHLPFVYNVCSTAFYSYLPALKQCVLIFRYFTSNFCFIINMVFIQIWKWYENNALHWKFEAVVAKVQLELSNSSRTRLFASSFAILVGYFPRQSAPLLGLRHGKLFSFI